MKEDIRKKFIVDEDAAQQVTEQLIEKALRFGRISKSGRIIIDRSDLSQDNKLRIALILRFLAHQLDSEISESVRPVELTGVIGEKGGAVVARLGHIVKEGFAKKSGRGEYVVYHYKIESFLDEMEVDADTHRQQDGVQRIEKKHKTTKKQKKTLGKNLSKIAEDIQMLVDNGFFKTPKFVTEAKKKLEEEARYHDIRSIDTSIRKTFVVNKQVLRRIHNEGQGKAKWKYVNR